MLEQAAQVLALALFTAGALACVGGMAIAIRPPGARFRLLRGAELASGSSEAVWRGRHERKLDNVRVFLVQRGLLAVAVACILWCHAFIYGLGVAFWQAL